MDSITTETPNLLTVIMPAFNAAGTIGVQLEALSRQSYIDPWELVIVDGGSTDQTREIAESYATGFPSFRFIVATERRGSAYARNTGCRLTKGDPILFCDADDVVDPNWITELAMALRTSEMVGGSLERRLLNGEVALSARPPKAVDGLLNTFQFLPYAITANCGVRRQMWETLHGFDEFYVNGSDDADFCFRVQLSGATLRFAPRAIVHYRLRSDAISIARQSYGYGVSHPRLFRAFKKAGMPRSSLRLACREWMWIVLHIFYAKGPDTLKALWFKRAATAWGRLAGSVIERSLYL